ncbi:hypothetical protein KXX25_000132 [Aspergillus fumigatus]|nr:hypothetical protein KXX28_001096 [Aspergillus fumigatus]KAH1735706.1 hypothetical protein KXX25_000132 [Aspergillus fumigatus]KAH2416458.1 hypothetical protein KXV44_000386 [Aspergillus fumigatus]KAH2498244.1 hypothetical protein KXV76_003899 [Aspergillus fumigatus]KAH2736558.1 hypothetical protein KXW77_000904 [Aspergillus fumigatus]
MAASEDLINFDIIENQKENIQSLPGGRSAKELARIFSPRDSSDKLAAPSPNETRTLNDAIRQEYEAELQAIDDSDDPLDIYDRYVKWTLNAYPSAQATAESGLLPLLERAVRAFLSSAHYKNDPRYLRLWLHYIRLFSDSPRETFAFLARHHIGEGLALFYEEFAAWLEGAGRWTQAEEVYRLGIDREARPTERLIRKYTEFQKRYEQRTQDHGPSSPALPAVRPALAAKVDPFSLSAAAPVADPQAQRPAPAAAAAPRTKSGKPKMTIFSDADSAASQPAISGQTKGWDSIGSMRERRKENSVEAKPWVGETLKAGKKAAPKEKMPIFRDEDPTKEVSFEELRAMHRGWMDKDWRPQMAPFKKIPGNIAGSERPAGNVIEQSLDQGLSEQFSQKLKVKDAGSQGTQRAIEDGLNESKANKARKIKLREVKGETQTIKMKFDSPTGGKIRRKSTAEPTMTIHTRAATDEIYSIFNQPLKAETENVADSSDFEDDDYTSAGESTCTGRISITSSDFCDDETTTFHRSDDEAEEEDFEDHTHAESVVDGEWTQFSSKEDPTHSLGVDPISPHGNTLDAAETSRRERFVPEMPEDYNPPYGPYRDPAVVAQNRLPFMTPIVEQTEHSLPSMTAARNALYNTKTPSKPQMGNFFTTPLIGATPQQTENLTVFTEDVAMSPTVKKARSGLKILSPLKEQQQQQQHRVIINDSQCNPTDRSIRESILQAVDPPLASYPGYHCHPEVESHYAPAIQKFVKRHVKRPRSGDEASFDVPILELPGAQRCYIIRRELGAGAYAPVYLAESVDSLENYPSSDSEAEPADDDSPDSQFTNGKKAVTRSSSRYGFEAIKLEVGPPNAWEFYMIRIAHERISQLPELSRATDSIIRAHELHVYKRETILVEDYHGQGTLLDLVNHMRNESIKANGTGEGGLDEALAMFFTVELFRTVEALHSCGILHGDIKADNCLIRFDDKPTAPSLVDLEEEITDPREIYYSPRGLCGWRNKGLSLIDFGRGIDMRAFQPSVQFIADWETGEHECNEIREMRPWTHQIDLYGIAGTVHVMLFGKYIESTPVRKSEGGTVSVRTYRIRESLKRYWDREIWTDVFDLLLNPCTERWARMELDAAGPDQDLRGAGNQIILPVTHSMRYVREKMEAWLLANAEKKGLGLQIRKLEAVFAEKKKKLERS